MDGYVRSDLRNKLGDKPTGSGSDENNGDTECCEFDAVAQGVAPK